MARKAKIEIFPSDTGEGHFVRVRAANGEILIVSEGYVTKGNAKRAAKRLANAVAGAAIIEVDS